MLILGVMICLGLQQEPPPACSYDQLFAGKDFQTAQQAWNEQDPRLTKYKGEYAFDNELYPLSCYVYEAKDDTFTVLFEAEWRYQSEGMYFYDVTLQKTTDSNAVSGEPKLETSKGREVFMLKGELTDESFMAEFGKDDYGDYVRYGNLSMTRVLNTQ